MTAIEAAATRLTLPLVDVFTDAGVSGSLALEQRPGLLTAIDALANGDTLIVAKRDRLGRSVLNVALITRLIERKRARIYSAAGEGSDDDGPTSVLMRQIIDAFSEYERQVIRARTKAALAALKARNQRVGGIPLGRKLASDGRTLIPNEDELRVLRVLRDLRAAGMTLRGVAAELNRLGYRTRCGGFWYHKYVCRQLAKWIDGKDIE